MGYLVPGELQGGYANDIAPAALALQDGLLGLTLVHKGAASLQFNADGAIFVNREKLIPFMNDGTWKYLENPEEVSLNTLHLNIEILDMAFIKKKMIRYHWETPKARS